MLLLRLSGHSGAGKSRLLAELPKLDITCPRAVLYTSRLARTGERHGQDYYFLSRSAIAALPAADFYIGPVREMLQAVDLSQLETTSGLTILCLSTSLRASGPDSKHESVNGSEPNCEPRRFL